MIFNYPIGDPDSPPIAEPQNDELNFNLSVKIIKLIVNQNPIDRQGRLLPPPSRSRTLRLTIGPGFLLAPVFQPFPPSSLFEDIETFSHT